MSDKQKVVPISILNFARSGFRDETDVPLLFSRLGTYMYDMSQNTKFWFDLPHITQNCQTAGCWYPIL